MTSRSSTPFLAAFCVVIAFVAGVLLGGHPGSLPEPGRDAFDLGGEDEGETRSQLIDSIEGNF